MIWPRKTFKCSCCGHVYITNAARKACESRHRQAQHFFPSSGPSTPGSACQIDPGSIIYMNKNSIYEIRNLCAEKEEIIIETSLE